MISHFANISVSSFYVAGSRSKPLPGKDAIVPYRILLLAFAALTGSDSQAKEAPPSELPRPAVVEVATTHSQRSPKQWLAEAEDKLTAGQRISAQNLFIEALAAAFRIGDQASITAAHGGLCQLEGSFASALAHCWAAVEGAQSGHNKVAEMNFRLHLGKVLLRVGQYSSALEELTWVRENALEAGREVLAFDARESLAETLAAQGQLEAAREAFLEVQKFWSQKNDALREAGVRLRLAEVESALGRVRAAEPHLQAVLAIYRNASQSLKIEDVLSGMASAAAGFKVTPLELMLPTLIEYDPRQDPEFETLLEKRWSERLLEVQRTMTSNAWWPQGKNWQQILRDDVEQEVERELRAKTHPNGPFRKPRTPLGPDFRDKLRRAWSLSYPMLATAFEAQQGEGLDVLEMSEAVQQWSVFQHAKFDEASGFALLQGLSRAAVCSKFQISEIESARAALFHRLHEPERRQAALRSAWTAWEESSGVVIEAQENALQQALKKSGREPLLAGLPLLPGRRSYNRELLLRAGLGPPLSITRTLCGLRSSPQNDQWLSAESRRLEGKHEEARALLRHLKIEGNLESTLLTRVLLSLGRTNLALGDSQAALAAYQEAVEGIEWQQGDLAQQPIEFASLYSDLYAELAQVHANQEDAASAFIVAERSRAYDFHRHLLGTSPSTRAASSSDVARLRAIERLLLGMQPQRQFLDLGESESEFARAMGRRILELHQEWAELRARIPPSAALGYSTVSLPGVLQVIGGSSASLISYYVTEGETFAWVVAGDSIHLERLPVGRAALAQKVEVFRQWIGDRGAQRTRSPAFDKTTAAWFYDQLVAPLVRHVQSRDVIVVPHGPLQYLPFAALWDGERYLNERWDTSVVPSATALASLANNKGFSQGRTLVLGDPDGSLPAAAREAREVAAVFSVKPLLGEQATRQQLEILAPKVDVLHVAAHALFDSADPVASHLQLAPTGSSGKLSVTDVSTLDLHEVDLAVLSACETSVGAVSDGDDVVGLTRAFLSAGARSLVTTLWPVDDEASAALMTAFYRRVSRPGVNLATALAAAQREVASEPQWQAPYFWAGYVLHGQRRPVVP
jgi:CHAT domain-containing protein/tetratricopeptide (TPR) repeat protein